MELGVWLFPSGPLHELLSAIELAEAEGLDAVWLGDEGPTGWDPFVVAALAIPRTARIRFGVAVANPITRHPGVTAMLAATLSEASGGRFAMLGFGAGGSLPLDPYGLRIHEPVETLRNCLATARAVLTGEPSATYQRPPGALSGPEVQLWVGARGPRMNKLASRVADGVFLSGIDSFQLPVVAGWARVERPVDVATYLTACPDPALANEILPGFVRSLSNGPVATIAALEVDPQRLTDAVEQLERGNKDPARELMVGSVCDALVATGSPEHMAKLLVESVRSTAATSCGLALVHRDLQRDVRAAAEAVRLARLLLGVGSS